MIRLAFEHPDGTIRLGVACEACADTFSVTPEWRNWRRPITGAACQLCKALEPPPVIQLHPR